MDLEGILPLLGCILITWVLLSRKAPHQMKCIIIIIIITVIIIIKAVAWFFSPSKQSSRKCQSAKG